MKEDKGDIKKDEIPATLLMQIEGEGAMPPDVQAEEEITETE